jgi:CheY-like chemotaxis protein
MSIVVSKPTCFRHPVKIVFLDDNQTFLDMLSMEFGQKDNMIMLTDPNDAMFLINESRGDIVELSRLVSSDNADCKRGHDNNILNIMYDKSRFDNVAVLVIDYEMPTINGIEFCKKLIDRNIYKILLTAEADKDMAINAFNNGIINKFILKTNDNLYEEILTSIDDLTVKYFNEFSKSYLNGSVEKVKHLLNNNSYKKIFNEVMTDSDAVEYYLVDDLGSYLFLDKNAKPTWLIVCDQQKANEQADLLSGYGFAESTIKKIKNKENILFLLSDSEHKESALNWKQYILESNKLDNDYSYSVVSGSLAMSISWESVAPYEKDQATS